jgi:hypothetical protein
LPSATYLCTLTTTWIRSTGATERAFLREVAS